MDWPEKKRNIFLVKKTTVADSPLFRSSQITFKLGEIVYLVYEHSPLLFVVTTKDMTRSDTGKSLSKDDEWLVHRIYLTDLDENLVGYMLPVTPHSDRVRLVDKKDSCRKLMKLKPNDIVLVLSEKLQTSALAGLTEDKEACVKYKGPIPELGPGIYFGVELLMPENGDVNADLPGHSGFKHYFTCKPLSGLIITANQLELEYEYSAIGPSCTYQQMERENSCGGFPFKKSHVEQTRAKFESMPQYSQYGSRSVDHTGLDLYKQAKSVPTTASCVQKGTEDFFSPEKIRTSLRTEMDKTVPSQPSRPDKLFPSEAKRRDVQSMPTDYSRNGNATSPHENEAKHLSNDQFYKKDKKLESDFSYYPNSYTTSSGKTTPVGKVNGGLSHTSTTFSDTVDGYKAKNTARPVKINNTPCPVKQVSTTNRMRDDHNTDYKLTKVNNFGATSTLHSPGYSSSVLNSHSDPVGNHFPSSSHTDHNLYYEPDVSYPSPDSYSDFEIGSVVEVEYNGKSRFGVIRWIGEIREKKSGAVFAGIETEAELEPETISSNGSFGGIQYFTCHDRRGIFVNLNKCKKDRRFQEDSLSADGMAKTFGHADCPKIEGRIPPIIVHRDLHKICGKPKGIQGHHNSCYLDATLFSMFTFTSVFDSLLYRPRTSKDTAQYTEVQSVLRDEIVNPLRKNMFVRADRVMKLRTLLEKHSSVSGLTSEEKDPEEFLNSLVAQMLRAEPFLKLNSGQEAFYYQLFVEKDENLKFPSVQNLFEQSFLASDIKLKEVPSCLIIQMPRFGKSFKMYPRILPSPLLDVTDVIDDSPRQCIVCGKLATYECKACMKPEGLESISYCEDCLGRAHVHPECRNKRHECKQLSVPVEFEGFQDICIPRLYMELFAVVCIETSHYVSFVKCGDGPDAPWCFFDSMADRNGEQNGFNIPEVSHVAGLPLWLTEEAASSFSKKRDRDLPEHAKRLLCDAYMCMYRSSEVMMYR